MHLERLPTAGLEHAAVLQELPGHADPITSLDFDRKGELIVSASYEGFCRIWEVATGACRRTIHMDEQNSPVVHVSFTPNGKYLLMATLDSTLRLWDAATNKCLKKYKGRAARSPRENGAGCPVPAAALPVLLKPNLVPSLMPFGYTSFWLVHIIGLWQAHILGP